MMPNVIEIRPMLRADLHAVARVHRSAFTGFFLDRMGPAFLREYYAAVLSYPGAVAIVAQTSAGELTGFAAGFLDPAGFYAHFRTRRLRLLPAILLAVIRNPSLLRLILSNSRRIQGQVSQGASVGELASIGVTTPGGGLGSQLLAEFCEGMFRRGVEKVVLSTDAADNDATRAFYERRGFRIIGTERRGDRVLCLYERPRDAMGCS